MDIVVVSLLSNSFSMRGLTSFSACIRAYVESWPHVITPIYINSLLPLVSS